MIIEITTGDFVGDGSKDDEVLWVEAESVEYVRTALGDIYVRSVEAIDVKVYGEADIDFALPRDMDAFTDRLA